MTPQFHHTTTLYMCMVFKRNDNFKVLNTSTGVCLSAVVPLPGWIGLPFNSQAHTMLPVLRRILTPYVIFHSYHNIPAWTGARLHTVTIKAEERREKFLRLIDSSHLTYYGTGFAIERSMYSHSTSRSASSSILIPAKVIVESEMAIIGYAIWLVTGFVWW